MNTFVFTCGDINGIGPEIVVKSLNKISVNRNKRIIFVCPENVFQNTISFVKPKFSYIISKTLEFPKSNKEVIVLDIGNYKQNIGKSTISSGKASYKSIIKACELAKEKIADSVITAPISKVAFNLAKVDFPGHTELFANYFNVSNFSMMFVSDKMKAGLLTIHIPIKDVSKKITQSSVQNTIEVIIESLKNDFGLVSPNIALLGLNPHAGEEGKIGKEEIEILNPIVKKYKQFLSGTYVPDAFFGNKLYKNFDCTIGIYHDQLLIPFKLLNFNKGVNFTAGLPIVRTSPDHGTAFDIAGKNLAKEGSLLQAFKYANIIVNNRKANLA